jgi:hypothetical protein
VLRNVVKIGYQGINIKDDASMSARYVDPLLINNLHQDGILLIQA